MVVDVDTKNGGKLSANTPCPRCETEVSSKRGLSRHYAASHEGNHWLIDTHGAEEIMRLYVDEGMSENKLADHFDTTRYTMKNVLELLPTERRGQAEAERRKWEQMSEEERAKQVEAAHEARRKGHANYRISQRGDAEWTSNYYENGEQTKEHVKVHRLTAVAEYGFDAVADSIVHHKIPVRWLNFRKNLQLFDSHSEHKLHHDNTEWEDDFPL